MLRELSSEELESRRREGFAVPDSIDERDAAMCLRWQILQTEPKEQSLREQPVEEKSLEERLFEAGWLQGGYLDEESIEDELLEIQPPAPRPSPPSTTPKDQAWQPPPTYTFAGGSTKKDQKLWKKCTHRIEAGIARETDQQSRCNMEACLEWVRCHGYPTPGYFLVWAACGIATCTTRGEFSRFWAAHGKLSDRTSVYALGISHVDGTVVEWRYGLATANLGAPPSRVGYEETWPEHFVMTEWLDQISWEQVEVRRGFARIPVAPREYHDSVRNGIPWWHHQFEDLATDGNS